MTEGRERDDFYFLGCKCRDLFLILIYFGRLPGYNPHIFTQCRKQSRTILKDRKDDVTRGIPVTIEIVNHMFLYS